MPDLRLETFPNPRAAPAPRRHRAPWILGGVALLIAAVAAGAVALLPSWLRGRIERGASELLGREVKIAGSFGFSLSLAPTLRAEEVTLANAPWGSEPFMVRADRVRLSVNLLSLRTGPVRIQNLELEGVRILLETGDDGRGNWEFQGIPPSPRPPPPGAPARPPFVLDHAAIRRLELIHRPRRGVPPLRLGVDLLEASLDPATGMVEVAAGGHFNDVPWNVAGRLGTYERLCELRDVEHALTGRVGGAAITLRGRIRDPLALGDPNVEMEIEGPDITAALATVGLRAPLSGPFRLRGRLSPSKPEGLDFDLSAGLAGAAVTARGHVGALLKPDLFEAQVEASGPDAGVVGEWTGIEGLPRQPFEVSGLLRRDGARIRIGGTKIRLGGASAELEGLVGEPPRYIGTDLSVAARGRNLSELSALVRLPLPAGPFAIRGRLRRQAEGLTMEEAAFRAGETVVRASGVLGEPPRLSTLDLALEASGPDLSWFSGISGVALPRSPFHVRGRVARRGPAFGLEGIEGRLGDDRFVLEGALVPAPRLAGSEIQARITGPDLARAGSLAGIRGLPPEPYAVSGRVHFTPDGLRLEGVDGRAGRLEARVEGRLGAQPAVEGTALEGRVRGPALSDLVAWGAPAGLPREAFTFSGRLRIDGGVTRVEQVTGEVGADRISVEGVLGRLPDTSELELAVEGSGPRLADLGRFLSTAGAVPPKRLPAGAYAFSARLRRAGAGLELGEARVRLGPAEIRMDGVVGSGDRLRGTDLRFEARAPDGALAEGLSGVRLPAGPVEIRGRIEGGESGILLDGVSASLGGMRAGLSGTLGEPPALAGTDLEMRIEGPDLAAALGPVTGISPLPAERFEASAHVRGSADRWVADPFAASLGGSDVEGRISASRDGRPFVEADLQSRRLDIPELLRGFLESSAEAPEAPGSGQGPSRQRDRLIPDEPLKLEALGALDGRVRIRVAEAALPGTLLHEVAVEGELREGALRVDRVEGSGFHGGRATASLSFEPGDDGYRLVASGAIAGARIGATLMPEEAEQTPSLDAEFSVEGTGRSLHAIAAGSRGRVLVTLGPGRIPRSLGDLAIKGPLQGLLDALNPFRKSSPYTELECAVAAAGIEDGKVVAEPIAARTDKLAILGRGKVDLESEEIDLVWTLKPRQGVGITASSIANPYIKLGGTLAAPSLEAKPLQAVTSTGAAVATGGLTILFRGLYDRVTAEKKVCLKALEKARKQEETSGAGHP